MSHPRAAGLPLPLRVALPGSRGAVRRLRGLRRASARHPEWWILLVSALAWGWMWIGSGSPAGHAGSARGIAPAALATAVMVVAMMLPLTIGQLRALARATPWRGRHLRTAAFVAGFLALWMLAMGMIEAAWSVSAGIAGPVVASAIVVGAAAMWEMAPARRRLHVCDGAPVIAGRAWSGCAMDGVTAGSRCVGACWALMAACPAFAHSVPAMAVLFAVQLNGRLRRAIPPAGAALALVGLWLVFLAIGTGTETAGSHHH